MKSGAWQVCFAIVSFDVGISKEKSFHIDGGTHIGALDKQSIEDPLQVTTIVEFGKGVEALLSNAHQRLLHTVQRDILLSPMLNFTIPRPILYRL